MEVGKHRVKTCTSGKEIPRLSPPKAMNAKFKMSSDPLDRKTWPGVTPYSPASFSRNPAPSGSGRAAGPPPPPGPGPPEPPGRGDRGLVGVEFDVLLVPGLLSGVYVSRPAYLVCKKSAHGVSSAKAGSNRMSTLRAWPVRPSFLAKLDTDIWAFSRALLV